MKRCDLCFDEAASRFDCIFAGGENSGFAPSMNLGMIATGNHYYSGFAARSTTVASNSPPDCCDLIFQIWRSKIKRPKPNGFGLFMELLARFELATSSLPKISRLFCAVADCCSLTPETLAPQRVSAFSFCDLPYLVASSLWRFYGAGVGFVAVLFSATLALSKYLLQQSRCILIQNCYGVAHNITQMLICLELYYFTHFL